MALGIQSRFNYQKWEYYLNNKPTKVLDTNNKEKKTKCIHIICKKAWPHEKKKTQDKEKKLGNVYVL